jgi:hypothetical protein
MNKYSVTFNLPNEKGFLDFVNRIGPLVGKFEVHMSQTVDETVAAKPMLDQSAMSAPRGKRKSKVVETILSTLRIGEALPEALRGALASAGMSESSLSTGLAILQKSGEIKRGSDGAYYLSVREAA